MLPMRREEENYTLGMFMTLADGLQSVFAQHGMDLVMYAGESWDDEFARLRRIVERRRVDGVMLAGAWHHDERLDCVDPGVAYQEPMFGATLRAPLFTAGAAAQTCRLV